MKRQGPLAPPEVADSPARRGLASVLAAVIVAAMAMSAAAQDMDKGADTRRKLEALQSEIEDARKREQELQTRSQSVGQELSNLQSRLVRAANVIQETEERATTLEARVAELSDRLARQNERLEARHGDLATTFAALQRVSRQPPELVFLRPDDAINTVRSARLLASVMPILRAEAEALKQDLKILRELKAELDIERAELAESLNALEHEQQELDTLLAERRKEQEQLQRETLEERARLARYAAQAENLESLIQEVEAELERRRRAAEAAAERLAKRPELPRSATQAPPLSDTAFRDAAGTMPLPVRGSFVRQFGERDELGNTSRGVTIETRAAAQVVSPFDGRVVFAGPFRNYGQILIIAHGGGYHTLLAGMGRVTGVVGQWVLAGEPVGQMAGDTAPDATSSRPRLYVELRSDGKPVNPMRWLASGTGKASG